jgi:two-component system response regulator HydG
MANKALSAQVILDTIEGYVSGENNADALRYIESHVLPIIDSLEKSSPANFFYSLLYNLSNIYYLNHKYKKSLHFLDMLNGTDFGLNSIDCIILRSSLLNLEGKYSTALKLLREAQSQDCPKEHYYSIEIQIGITRFWQGNYSQAIQSLNRADAYFKNGKNWIRRGGTKYMLGYIAFQRCFFGLAETYYSKALEDFKLTNKNQQIGQIHKMIGILCYRTGRYADAKKHIMQALKCYRKCNDRISIINSLLALARILNFAGEYQKASEILAKTKIESSDLGCKREIGISCEYLADAHYGLGEYNKALRVLKVDAQIAAQIAPEGDLAVEAYRRMSDVYLALGNTTAAERMANKTIALAEKLEDKYELGSILRVFGLLAAKRGDHDLARSYFNESIITLKMIKESFELARTSRTAAEYYEELFSSDVIPLECRTELLEEARSHAVEAMHLYSLQELDGPAKECKKLVDSIESKLVLAEPESRPREISFDSKWLHSGFVVGRSPNALTAIAKTGDLAIGDIPVLVTGETGTGKELIARLIHKLSLRAKGPFVPVNCASIPETIFESELFGHRKGSFTGAVSDRRGLMEAASGGTLFLDEISELSNQQQAKLLRALQEGMIRRVGETTERPVDVRVISASNDDVESLVATGRIRKDFYYRICVETIALDPLRRRREDIPALFAYYLDGKGKGFEVEEGVLELLDSYHWPGNVRELVGVVKILRLLAGESGIVRICDLPLKIRDAASAEHGTAHIDRTRAIVPRNILNSKDADDEGVVEKLIRSSLSKHGGNKAAAARDLGISRATLYRRMQELDIQ